MPTGADYTIEYCSEAVQEGILELPDTLAARYVVLTGRMAALGPNLGAPYTEAFGIDLFECDSAASRGSRGFLLHARRPANRHVARVRQEGLQDAAPGTRVGGNTNEKSET
jgi:hypothetical protein